MRIIPFLLTIALVKYWDITNCNTEVNAFLFAPQEHLNTSDSQLTKLKVIEAKSSDYGPLSNKLYFEKSSEPDFGRIMLQSDIAMSTEGESEQIVEDVKSGDRRKRQILKNLPGMESSWKNGVVFYTFNTSDHVVQKLFRKGTKIWSDASCIEFVEDKNAQDKVVVIKGDGCFAKIGRRGGDQVLALSENVTVGFAVHEIGHALGFLHTMSRFDRDKYIRIIIDNLDLDLWNDFGILGEPYTEVYGLAYDFGSVMHYGELSGSINGDPTLVSRVPFYQKTMGSEMISFSDIFMINQHYKCGAKCNMATSAKCANEGFPHPRNCSICICPGGYGGALCDRRPPGCGQDLVATTEKQTVNQRLGNGSDLREDFEYCNYMISAPEGKKIEVDVLSMSRGYDKGGCPKGGVEIKAQADQKLTGHRFCSTKGTWGPIVSSFNVVPVILFNRFGTMATNFTYRYIN